MSCCTLCERPLDVDEDPLSGDCGGDCWGCIGLIEATYLKAEESIKFVELEIAWGWREENGAAKPQSVFLADPDLCNTGQRLH